MEDQMQQCPRPLRLNISVGEYPQFAKGAVRDSDKNGQQAGSLER